MRWLFGNRRTQIEVQRSFAARPKTVWNTLLAAGWLDGEAQWQEGFSFMLWDGTRIKVHLIRPPHQLAFYWIPMVGDRTDVNVTINLLPNGRTQVTFRQVGLSKDTDSKPYQARWEKALDAIGDSVKGRLST